MVVTEWLDQYLSNNNKSNDTSITYRKGKIRKEKETMTMCKEGCTGKCNGLCTGGTVPVWEKYALTIGEATQYFNIGDKKLRSIVEENSGNNRIILMNGTKTLIKRENFSKFLDQTGSI